jgi:hypothetical protein
MYWDLVRLKMTKDEALKMAIEAMTKADNYFEQLCSLLITFGVSPSELNMQKDTFLIKPINACKEALEQPALTDEKCGGCGMNYCECGERIDWSDPRYDD